MFQRIAILLREGGPRVPRGRLATGPTRASATRGCSEHRVGAMAVRAARRSSRARRGNGPRKPRALLGDGRHQPGVDRCRTPGLRPHSAGAARGGDPLRRPRDGVGRAPRHRLARSTARRLRPRPRGARPPRARRGHRPRSGATLRTLRRHLPARRRARPVRRGARRRRPRQRRRHGPPGRDGSL